MGVEVEGGECIRWERIGMVLGNVEVCLRRLGEEEKVAWFHNMVQWGSTRYQVTNVLYIDILQSFISIPHVLHDVGFQPSLPCASQIQIDVSKGKVT